MISYLFSQNPWSHSKKPNMNIALIPAKMCNPTKSYSNINPTTNCIGINVT